MVTTTPANNNINNNVGNREAGVDGSPSDCGGYHLREVAAVDERWRPQLGVEEVDQPLPVARPDLTKETNFEMKKS